MPFTRGAREVPNQTPASTSDARKRQAEKDHVQVHGVEPMTIRDNYICADLPPSLPDTSGWVRREPGDVIEAGTPYRADDDRRGSIEFFLRGSEHQWTVPDSAVVSFLTPPPVEPAPWERLSHSAKMPTDASVNGVPGRWYVDAGLGYAYHVQSNFELADITSVELLHTHNPETHVPVERALIDEAVRWVSDVMGGPRRAADITRALAALAHGAKS